MSSEDKKREREEMRRAAEQLRRQQQDARDKKIQARLDAEAAEEAAIKRADAAGVSEIEDIFVANLGASIEEIRKAYLHPDLDPGEKQAMKEAMDAARGGFFSGPNPKKVRKVVQKNQKAIKSGVKRSRSGCLFGVVALALIAAAVLAGMGYGAVAVALALF